MAVHACSDRTKFARDLNLRAKEGGWFGSRPTPASFPAYPSPPFCPCCATSASPSSRKSPCPRAIAPATSYSEGAAAVALLTRRNTPAYGFYRKNGFEGVEWRAWMVRPCSPEA